MWSTKGFTEVSAAVSVDSLCSIVARAFDIDIAGRLLYHCDKFRSYNCAWLLELVQRIAVDALL